MRFDATEEMAAVSRMRRAPRRSPRRVASLGAAGVLGGVAFGAMAVASARRATEPADRALHATMRRQLDEADVTDAAESVAPKVDAAGKWWVYTPVSIIAAVAALTMPAASGRQTRRRPRIVGAAAVALVPGIVSVLSPLLDEWIPQPPVGPRRRPVDHPVFPSGHAFRTTAVALTAAYVLSRGQVVPAGIAWPVATVTSAAIGIARLIREKHLASDVVGGWIAGATIASIMCVAVELAGGDAGED